MAQILPFIPPGTAFDPETIEILSAAFENAWHRIAVNSGFGRPVYADAMREVVAKHIIERAHLGEREPIRLSDSAVAFLATNHKN